GQRKGSIRQWLTLRFTSWSPKAGTQLEKGSHIPGALLDIIVERIAIAFLERPESSGSFHHFSNAQDYHADKVEQQANAGEEFHTRRAWRWVSFTAGFPSGRDGQRRSYRRGVPQQQRPPRRMAVSCSPLSESLRLHRPRGLTSGSG